MEHRVELMEEDSWLEEEVSRKAAANRLDTEASRVPSLMLTHSRATAKILCDRSRSSRSSRLIFHILMQTSRLTARRLHK